MYRLVVDEYNRIRLPDELMRALRVEKGTVFLGREDKGTLILEREAVSPEPLSTEVEMIETDVFWLPVEIAYFVENVRVKCKDPLIEVWGDNRADGIQKFLTQANKLYR